MAAIALAFCASTCWGVADFFGGLKSRSLPVLTVLLTIEAAGLVVIAVAVAAAGGPVPSVGAVAAAMGAGCAGIFGLAAFYRALAIGTMSIVAPISAVGLALPVIVGLTSGDQPSAVQGAGLACAAIGVVLASREPGHEEDVRRASRQSIVLALVAAVGFGSYFVGADRAADEGVLWTLLFSRVAATPIIALVVMARRDPLVPPRRDLWQLAAIGIVDLSATGLYAWATTKGLLSIVAVVGSLYPIATVVLARLLLAERIARGQAIGVGAALTGVALLAAG